MTEKFSRYDTADYLKSVEHIAAYLEAVVEEAGDDAAFVAQAFGDAARAKGIAVGEDITFAEAIRVANAVGLRLVIQGTRPR